MVCPQINLAPARVLIINFWLGFRFFWILVKGELWDRKGEIYYSLVQTMKYPFPQEAQQSIISQSYSSITVLVCVCYRQLKIADISLPL